MTVLAVPYEIDSGRGVRIDDHVPGIDTLVAPESEAHSAELVVAEPGEIAPFRTLTHRRDQRVRRVSAKSLQIGAPVAIAGLVELDQHLADGQNIGHSALPLTDTAR